MKSKAKYTQARPRDRVREQEEACCNAWGRLQRQQFFPALPSGLTQAPRVEAGEYRRRFFFFFFSQCSSCFYSSQGACFGDRPSG